MSGANFGETSAELFANALKAKRQRELKEAEGLDPREFKTQREMDEALMTARQLKKRKKEEEERQNDERTRRRWERNYSSEDSGLKTAENQLQQYYCAFCGAYAGVLDCKLGDLPTRQTDGAHVVSEKKRIFKHSMESGQTKILRRAGGLEKQYRLNCKECGLWLAYRPQPLDVATQLSYLVSDALTPDPQGVRYKLAQMARAAAEAEQAATSDATASSSSASSSTI